jgi:hypothetical protein
MKRIFLTLTLAFSFTLGGQLLAQPAFAACPNATTSKGQIIKGIGATGSECDTDGVANFVSAVVKVLSIVVGIAAVIMLIVAGFKYITSGGDSNKVSSAKNTLIYALIGLAIAALAQVLVNYVFTTAKRSVTLKDNSNPIERRLPEA